MPEGYDQEVGKFAVGCSEFSAVHEQTYPDLVSAGIGSMWSRGGRVQGWESEY